MPHIAFTTVYKKRFCLVIVITDASLERITVADPLWLSRESVGATVNALAGNNEEMRKSIEDIPLRFTDVVIAYAKTEEEILAKASETKNNEELLRWLMRGWSERPEDALQPTLMDIRGKDHDA